MWVTKNPQDENVSLTNQTYEIHVVGDHPKDEARVATYPNIQRIIEKPRYIYPDQNHAENKRVKYIDHVYIQEVGYIQNVVVVVDTDRQPHEVVTWMVKSSTKQEKFEGGVIYDSSSSDNR